MMLARSGCRAQWSSASSTPRCMNGRGGPIRTGDLLLPKQVRYQAALRPDAVMLACQQPLDDGDVALRLLRPFVLRLLAVRLCAEAGRGDGVGRE